MEYQEEEQHSGCPRCGSDPHIISNYDVQHQLISAGNMEIMGLLSLSRKTTVVSKCEL